MVTMTGRQGPHGRAHHYACAACSWRSDVFGYECPRCAAPVLIEAEPLTTADLLGPSGARGLWRYARLLPTTSTRVTLGEADTPLVNLAEAASRELGWPGEQPLAVKLESLNPTLSFKDRAMALAASVARDRGIPGLVVASTGNAAVSAAAYAGAAGLRCRVIVGTSSRAATKLAAARAYGAEVEEIDGDYSTAYDQAKAAEGRGWMNVSTTYRNPLLAEAYRPIAFELIEQLGEAPAAVVVPVGAGPLLRGIERGFGDARERGLLAETPRMVAVQAAAISPVVDEWRRTTGVAADPGSPGEGPGDLRTVATAIADPLRGYESHGRITVAAVMRSRGAAVAVTEPAILRAHSALTRLGFPVEPSSATAGAALAQPELGELLSRADAGPVVLILTGHASKA